METSKTAEESDRGIRRVMTGVVTSAKMQKTIVVRVERFVRHPVFEKYMRRHTICYAHDEKGEAGAGDRVEIMQTRPLSKTKRWRLVKVVEKQAVPPERLVRRTVGTVKG